MVDKIKRCAYHHTSLLLGPYLRTAYVLLDCSITARLCPCVFVYTRLNSRLQHYMYRTKYCSTTAATPTTSTSTPEVEVEVEVEVTPSCSMF